ncbi:MAG: histidine kinase [Longimicrobiales bacterium]
MGCVAWAAAGAHLSRGCPCPDPLISGAPPLYSAVKIVLAWTPFLLLWALFVRINADIGILASLRSGLFGIGTAAILGQGVWWITGRFTWPDQMRASFYGLHAVLGMAYAVVWLLGSEIVGALVVEGGLPAELMRIWAWENSGWRLLMGLWLYGLVAGVSYALRIRATLREQERASARLEALATRARLESLRARLNPHFLFNALNSVAALIPDDPEAAENAVERLARLLRYSLTDSGGAVPLADEWAFTRAYLDMEMLRLGNRLEIVADLGPGTEGVPVLPFSVQTLVENAVRHAAAARAEGARISVRAVREGRDLTVRVEDDGPGCDLREARGGTGLSNLTERLRGAYGGKAALDLDSTPGRGFRAEVRVPAAGPVRQEGDEA